jgi:histidinol-phosphate aminotransferase
MLPAKPNLDKLFPCSHGGINYREILNLGIPLDTILDFSTNCNPFGPPPDVQDAIATAPIASYPDSEATELRQTLATKLSISPDNLLMGSGSTELIRLIALACFNHQDPVLIPQPTYGEYEIACHLVGANVLHQPLFDQPNFRLNVKNTLELICQHQPKGIFLCNPNNPTGQYLSQQEIDQILYRICLGITGFTKNA